MSRCILHVYCYSLQRCIYVERNSSYMLTPRSFHYLEIPVLDSWNDIAEEFFPNVFLVTLSTSSPEPSSSITFERRQISLWPISPTLSKSHLTAWPIDGLIYCFTHYTYGFIINSLLILVLALGLLTLIISEKSLDIS